MPLWCENFYKADDLVNPLSSLVHTAFKKMHKKMSGKCTFITHANPLAIFIFPIHIYELEAE